LFAVQKHLIHHEKCQRYALRGGPTRLLNGPRRPASRDIRIGIKPIFF
jgi:hypothetical protein